MYWDFGYAPAASLVVRLVGQTGCSFVAAWLSLVAVGFVEGTSGSEGIGHSVVFENSSGFVGNVDSIEFQVYVGGTGTFVGVLHILESRESLVSVSPIISLLSVPFSFIESTSSLVVSLLSISISLSRDRHIVLI